MVVEVMKIMVTSFKRSHACTATLSAPNPAAGHHRPMPPLETLGHSQASLGHSLVGSLLLSPRSWCTRFCLCLQESVSQSCVSSGSSMVGLMATSSKRAYAISTSAAPRASVPAAGHCWPVPPQETPKHSSGSVSGSWCAQSYIWALWASLAGMGFDSECDFTPPAVLLGLLLCPVCGIFPQSRSGTGAAAGPAPTALLRLLCPWTWGISSQLLQHQAADVGCLPHRKLKIGISKGRAVY